MLRLLLRDRARHATSTTIVAKPTPTDPIAADSLLSDFVIEPNLDGLSNTDVPQIVESCVRQFLAIGEIEQTPRRVI